MPFRWLIRTRSLVLGMGGAFLLMAFSAGSPATPVYAASSLASHAGLATASPPVSPAKLLTMLAKSQSSYTPKQLAGAKAYLMAHPFQGTIQYVSPSGTQTAPTGVRPLASVGVYWWGVRIYLTNADVVNLFWAIMLYGSAAVAAALCSPGVWLMVLCGLIGTIVGWIVVEVVLQSTDNFGGCNLNIDIPWDLNWYWYCT